VFTNVKLKSVSTQCGGTMWTVIKCLWAYKLVNV